MASKKYAKQAQKLSQSMSSGTSMGSTPTSSMPPTPDAPSQPPKKPQGTQRAASKNGPMGHSWMNDGDIDLAREATAVLKRPDSQLLGLAVIGFISIPFLLDYLGMA